MPEPISVGFLYPGMRAADGALLHQAQDDYPRAERLLGLEASLVLVNTRVEEDAHREDALLRTGAAEYLLEGAAELKRQGLRSAIWACTSGSFVLGLEGAKEQAGWVADFLEVPASSTSLAFIDACRYLGVGRVAIAGSYPADVVALLEKFLAQAGLEVVRARDAGIISGVGVGQQSEDWVFDLVRRADEQEAEAILVPDTAMHTISILDALDEAVGKPVLTANQVLDLARTRAGWPTSASDPDGYAVRCLGDVASSDRIDGVTATRFRGGRIMGITIPTVFSENDAKLCAGCDESIEGTPFRVSIMDNVAREAPPSWAERASVNPGPHQFHADPDHFRAWAGRRGHYLCRLSEVRELMRPTPLPVDPPAWGLCDGNHREDHEFEPA